MSFAPVMLLVGRSLYVASTARPPVSTMVVLKATAGRQPATTPVCQSFNVGASDLTSKPRDRRQACSSAQPRSQVRGKLNLGMNQNRRRKASGYVRPHQISPLAEVAEAPTRDWRSPVGSPPAVYLFKKASAPTLPAETALMSRRFCENCGPHIRARPVST